MDSRYFKRILTVFITMVLILSNSINIFASNDFMNKEDDYIDMIYTSDILGDEKADETIEIHRKEGNKVNTIIKEPTTMQNDKYEIALVEGGNMDAINPLATKQNIAIATSGAVGSDLANMINEAAINAVKNGRQVVSQADLFEAVEVVLVGKEKKDRIMSQKERRIVSYQIGRASCRERV